jgi:N-acetylneuraminic acid mutarotase
MAGVVGTKIYVCGGKDSSGALSSVEVYDTLTNTWSPGPPMPRAACDGDGTVLNGILYVVGTQGTPKSLMSLDPATNRWTRLAALPSNRQGVSVGALFGEIYVVGGREQVDGIESVLSRVDIYNPSSGTWRSGPAIPTARDGPSVVVMGNTMYVLAGLADGVSGVLEVYGAE